VLHAVDGDAGERGHPEEHREGELGAADRVADPVGQPSADRTGQGSDQGSGEAEAREVRRDERVTGQELRERRLDHEREREREADERTEGADVQERHDPGLPVRQRLHVGALVSPGRADAVHAGPGRDHGEGDEGHPHEPRVGEVHLVDGQLGGRGGDADDQRQRHEQLRREDAEVASGRVQAERPALLALRVEERDVRHRGGEVAAAEAGRPGADQQDPELGAVALLEQPATRHHDREQQGRDEEERGADRRPQLTAEAGHREGVRDPKERADEVRDQGQQEQLRHRHRDAGVAEVQDDDRPEDPHREAEVLGEHRPHEVALGDGRARLLPEHLVIRLPVVDPATPPLRRGRCRVSRRDAVRPGLRWAGVDRRHAATQAMSRFTLVADV
jgi:hypothetical protein